MEDTTAAPVEVKTEEADTEAEEQPIVDGPAHPYLEQINKCPANEWQMQKQDPTPCKTLEEVPHTVVDTQELLDTMMTKLKTEKEIAIGMKRFTYRSFAGINCLVQIATRTEVFLVDTIALKEEAKVLNEVLTSTDMLKVIHMGEGFVENMQKDLGLYFVNVFSLNSALRNIHMKANKGRFGNRWQTSLWVVLKERVGVDFDEFSKEFRSGGHHQDWHERPLSEEKVKCARLEVQYLLDVYDKLRNQLIDADSLKEVYEHCNRVCAVMWYPGKVSFKGQSHISLYRHIGEGWKHGRKRPQLNKIQFKVLEDVYNWRHETAEKHNEGRGYLLKDQFIYNIAKNLPADPEALKTTCLASETPCPLLEENLGQICELIKTAVDTLTGTPDAEEKVPFFPKSRNSVAGKKRKAQDNKVATGYANGQTPVELKNGAKLELNLEGKHPVSALAEHCSKGKLGMPQYSVVQESGHPSGKTFTMSVVVENVSYQPTEPSLNKKTAKAMAATLALKSMGLLPPAAET